MKLASSAGDDFCLHQSAKCESKCENRAEGNRTDGEHLDLELVLFFFFLVSSCQKQLRERLGRRRRRLGRSLKAIDFPFRPIYCDSWGTVPSFVICRHWHSTAPISCRQRNKPTNPFTDIYQRELI